MATIVFIHISRAQTCRSMLKASHITLSVGMARIHRLWTTHTILLNRFSSHDERLPKLAGDYFTNTANTLRDQRWLPLNLSRLHVAYRTRRRITSKQTVERFHWLVVCASLSRSLPYAFEVVGENKQTLGSLYAWLSTRLLWRVLRKSYIE